MALSLNAPIEDLQLSSRVRNVLRRNGFSTLGSILERDYKSTLRGFGPRARTELACALEAKGVALPDNLSSSVYRSSHCSPPHAKLAKLAPANSGVALAREFRRRLTLICSASAALSQATTLPASQQELVGLIEEECFRLGFLVNLLFGGWTSEESPPRLGRKLNDPVRTADDHAWCPPFSGTTDELHLR